MLFSDFMPVGGGPQMIATPLTTAGFDGDIASSWPNLKPDTSFVKTANGVKVELKIEPGEDHRRRRSRRADSFRG